MATVTLKNRMSASLKLCIGFIAATFAGSLAPKARAQETAMVKDIVLVHGANNDGSAWRGVYDILKKDGTT